MRLLQALDREPLDRPPVWFMRQAGRYLPEYRELRSRHTFLEAMTTPEVAAEITLQPLRRFPLDAAIIFSDIMTPLLGMGVSMEFDPGPKLSATTIEGVLDLPVFDGSKVSFVGETIDTVKKQLDPGVALIGFAGGPLTVLAYLLEGGGSQHFPGFRSGLRHENAEDAVTTMARATRAYLEMQVEAGVDVVQVFDTWAGLLSREVFIDLALPALQAVVRDLGVPTIYFVPGGTHLLSDIHRIGATAYGLDWRLGLDEAWAQVGQEWPVQGNLDPAALLADVAAVRRETRSVLTRANGRPGHIFNLGHGILPGTPIASVEAVIDELLAGTAEMAESSERKAV